MGISMMMMKSKPKGSRNRCEPSVLHILLAKITKRGEDEHLQFSLILLSALDEYHDYEFTIGISYRDFVVDYTDGDDLEYMMTNTMMMLKLTPMARKSINNPSSL